MSNHDVTCAFCAARHPLKDLVELTDGTYPACPECMGSVAVLAKILNEHDEGVEHAGN